MIKVKLLELLTELVRLNNEAISQALAEKNFIPLLLEEYERSESSSSMLSALNQAFLVAACHQNQ